MFAKKSIKISPVRRALSKKEKREAEKEREDVTLRRQADRADSQTAAYQADEGQLVCAYNHMAAQHERDHLNEQSYRQKTIVENLASHLFFGAACTSSAGLALVCSTAW